MDGSANPLFDTLFRPTVEQPPAPTPPPVADASAAPVRVTGTRTRAGNAMNRTRAALLGGAARAVAGTGTRIAMAQVATSAGVAKATLYNHFRTRDAVLAALVLDQVRQLVDAQADKPLADALVDAGVAISRNEVARGLAAVEPAALAAVARIDETAPAWQLARQAVSDKLADAGRGGADTVLRWLASFLLTPAAAAQIAADVDVLVAGLPVADDDAADDAADDAPRTTNPLGAPATPPAADAPRTA
ncbi:transcriptional regulator, TetR family [Jatrophihabitans endophyticus]|uniref:Transcriptional regulator, TetR family n=1 Tax=Jatrophihabitans endophyticus TaxID=1206085 RepID=A0A1M5MKG7_9ACTN|nr:TetR/AcrR family transcriptional regulator [Jatrophihabitans endophyticus]SHG77687.1 transcriptional regulator, TetR family [Jatrophihabitans endophyticus]